MELQRYSVSRGNIQARIVLRAKRLGITKMQLQTLPLHEIKAIAKRRFIEIAKKCHPDISYSKEIEVVVPNRTSVRGKQSGEYRYKRSLKSYNKGITFSVYQSAYDFIMSLSDEDFNPREKIVNTVPDIPNPWDTLRMAPRLPDGYGESYDHLWYQ